MERRQKRQPANGSVAWFPRHFEWGSSIWRSISIYVLHIYYLYIYIYYSNIYIYIYISLFFRETCNRFYNPSSVQAIYGFYCGGKIHLQEEGSHLVLDKKESGEIHCSLAPHFLASICITCKTATHWYSHGVSWALAIPGLGTLVDPGSNEQVHL